MEDADRLFRQCADEAGDRGPPCTAVYTDAVRITVLNENPVAINELYLYQADAGASLESYLSSVETALGKLTVGEYAGNVTRRRRPSSKSCWSGRGRRWTPD